MPEYRPRPRVVCISPDGLGPMTPDSAADAAVALKEARQEAAMALSEWLVGGGAMRMLMAIFNSNVLTSLPAHSMFSWNYGVIGGMAVGVPISIKLKNYW